MGKNLVKTIKNTIFQQELFTRGSGIVLGVSGGPDSVCLLDVLAKIAPKYDLKLLIAHVNYGLRGKDSTKDEQFVQELAEKYGLKIFILKPKIKGKSSENELRNIRYIFFEKVRKINNYDLIAVAHNADDQVETYLMRIIRGAGLAGLSAMKYKTVNLIRPLLGISREEILEYLKKNNLTYRTDKTNLQSLFLRNKIRNKLIPYLQKNFNPQIKKTIFGATTSISEDYSLISKLAEREAEAMKELSVKKLMQFHPALQKRILLQKISEIKMDLKDIESAHIEEILKALKSKKGKSQVVVFKGLKLTRKGDKVTINSLNNKK